MAIKVKAVERLLKFDKESEGMFRYVMSPVLYTRLSEDKVIEEASLRCGMPKAAVRSTWYAIGEIIKSWATEGHSVDIPGLGTMKFSFRSRAVEKVEDVASGLIEFRKVVFNPSKDIKKSLNDTSISISCYDRNGDLVKRVISADEGDDPELNQDGTPVEIESGNENSGDEFQNSNE